MIKTSAEVIQKIFSAFRCDTTFLSLLLCLIMCMEGVRDGNHDLKHKFSEENVVLLQQPNLNNNCI